MRRLGLALALLIASPALADEEEVAFDAAVAVEGALLTNPYEGPLSLKPLFAGRPRVTLGARYGLTNSLYAGVHLTGTGSFTASAAPHILVTPDVTVDGFTGELHSTQATAGLLATAGYRLDLGWNYTGFVELQAGPAATVWYHWHLAIPRTNPFEDVLVLLGPDRIPLTILPGAMVRLQGGFEARILDNFLVVVMPYVGGGWVGGVDVSAGVAVRASWVQTPWLP